MYNEFKGRFLCRECYRQNFCWSRCLNLKKLKIYHGANSVKIRFTIKSRIFRIKTSCSLLDPFFLEFIFSPLKTIIVFLIISSIFSVIILLK